MIPYIITNNAGAYVSQSTISDHRNGLGRLAECFTCKVKENLLSNTKTATLKVPADALHADKIARGGLLMFDDNEHIDQLWRINSISKTLKDGVVSINCNHISYDLNKLACRPFSATGIENIITALTSNYVSYTPFTYSTNIINTNVQLGIDVPTYYRDIIGGMDGNIIEKLHCEVDWNNLNVRFVQRRGGEKSLYIRYGVNVLDAQQEEAIADVYDEVRGYVKKGNDAAVIGLPYFVGTLPSYPKTKLVDFTSTFEDTDEITPATIKQHAQAWATENDVFTPHINFSVDWVNIDNSTGVYAELGDTVNVVLPNFGKYTARIVETTYDVLGGKLESIVVGNYNNNLADTIFRIKKDSSTLKAYPIGSYYTSAQNTNPAAIFGGQWTRTAAANGVFTFRRIS